MKNKKRQQGFTLIEMLIVIAISLVLVAIASPALIASIQASNEGSAAGTLKTVATAQVGYFNLFNGAYAPTAAALGGTESATACPSIPAATAACLLPDGVAKQLDAGTVSGYSYKYTPSAGGWSMSATPTSSFSGRKSYFVSNSGNVTYSNGLVAMTSAGTNLGQ